MKEFFSIIINKIKSIFNFNNIGKKIKNFAKWYCWIGLIIILVVAFFAFIVWLAKEKSNYLLVVSLVSAVVGPILIWVGSWMLYAFGELVEKVSAIERNTRGVTLKSQEQDKIDSERIERIERLRSNGVITEEEYKLLVSKNN